MKNGGFFVWNYYLLNLILMIKNLTGCNEDSDNFSYPQFFA
jgi:hypothetical protein